MEVARQELSAAYNILGHLGLDDHTYTHLSARAVDGQSYYIYPFGLRFEEVTPECLMQISLDGTVLTGLEYQYNKTGYIIHGEIYKARPDLKAIFHLHTPAMVSTSCLTAGLMPLTQWALHFYEGIAYHNYDSLALNPAQGCQLVTDLGDKYVALLRNHGAIISGRTIQEAMFYTHHLEQACKAQNLILATQQPLTLPSPEVCRKAVKDLLSFEKDLGQRDWQAWLRWLKRQNYAASSAPQTFSSCTS